MDTTLKGKIAVITGGANGIGYATAQLFLTKGAKVAIWDIDETAGQQAVVNLKSAGEVRFYKVNTTQFNAVLQTTQQVVADFGQIDILVNNAGITRDASMKKMSPQQWQQVLDVNLTGVFNCAKAVAPIMAQNKFGRILNAASVVAHYGNFGQSNYVATKAGVIGMTKVWAREFGKKGITSNAVAPGFIQTEMVETIPANIIDDLVSKTPVARMGRPEDIAHAYAFLASEAAGFINGAVLNVDGGIIF
ncbi:MAG: beta-ketoacyl-ACP reductase [Bacteroidota bacterium]